MHVPNPLGGYPLVLRKYNIPNYKNGELLLDYTKNKLYYIDKESGEKIDIAKSIYDKIIRSKLENSKIAITKESTEVSSDIPVIPDPEDRSFNSYYMNTYKASVFAETNDE